MVKLLLEMTLLFPANGSFSATCGIKMIQTCFRETLRTRHLASWTRLSRHLATHRVLSAAVAGSEVEHGKAVEISYTSLCDPGRLERLLPELERAFGDGPESLGILVVTGLSEDFPRMRRRALMQASRLAQLTGAELSPLEDSGSRYLVGWSRGREMFRGRRDVHKGSFYVNPTFDPEPPSVETHRWRAAEKKEEVTGLFPEYETRNIWPSEEVLPGFRQPILDLTRYMVKVGIDVARACDVHVKTRVPGYTRNHLEEMVRDSRTCKARLLHYFPTTTHADPSGSAVKKGEAGGKEDGGEVMDEEAWCGEHLDHGCLTALTSAIYCDDRHSPVTRDPSAATTTADEIQEQQEIDPKAGLYIRSRSGRVVKIDIPHDALAFQTGEALQVTTRGILRAVPHLVKGSTVPHVARNTMAVFMQPNLNDRLGPDGPLFKEFARGVVDQNYGIKDSHIGV